MISKLRLEAEGKTLDEVLKDIKDAIKQRGPSADALQVHDEHYERVHDKCFRARVVLGVGPKPNVTVNNPFVSGGSSGIQRAPFYGTVNANVTGTTAKAA